MTRFFDFNHRCEAMPDSISFCKINGSEVSQFTAEKYESYAVLHNTVLYGFRFCPYCGKSCDDMEGDDE